VVIVRRPIGPLVLVGGRQLRENVHANLGSGFRHENSLTALIQIRISPPQAKYVGSNRARA
jgi:hypothetical protein